MTETRSSVKIAYGLTQEVFATPKGNGETIIVGGIGKEANRWARVLTKRAAIQLWFHLTRSLFPEKSVKVTAMAQTAPLALPNESALTNILELVPNREAHTFQIVGRVGQEIWWFAVDDQNARTLWAALDVALYPAGWQGSTTHHNKLN